MAGPGKDYVLGKGKLYFDPFADGTQDLTGERYIGNTPELSTTSDQETLDHYDSDSGLNVKDESVVIESNVTGSYTTDNIDIENVNMFYGGEIENITVAAATGLSETFTAKKGRWLQLGTSDTNPNGVRNVTTVVVKQGATTIATDQYELNPAMGRIYLEDTADEYDDGDVLTVEYGVAAGTRKRVIGKGKQLAGALRFISENPVGTNKDYYWPSVKISANGDFNLKGDEWQTIPFNFEVLKKDDATERVYIEQR